jgi:hypothetical protein
MPGHFPKMQIFRPRHRKTAGPLPPVAKPDPMLYPAKEALVNNTDFNTILLFSMISPI